MASIHVELAQRGREEAVAPALPERNDFVRDFGGSLPLAASGNDGGQFQRKFGQLDAQLELLLIAGVKIARNVQMQLRDVLSLGERRLHVAKPQRVRCYRGDRSPRAEPIPPRQRAHSARLLQRAARPADIFRRNEHASPELHHPHAIRRLRLVRAIASTLEPAEHRIAAGRPRSSRSSVR